MNADAKIDSMLKTMSKPPVEASANFSDKEIFTGTTEHVVRKRIEVLMSRKVLTVTDINLLDVLLKYQKRDNS